MKKVRITVKEIAGYDDLLEQYENPKEHICDINCGREFIFSGREGSEGFCCSGWVTVFNFVRMPGSWSRISP